MRLSVYIVRRLIILIPTLIGVTLITFALSHAPGPNFAISAYCSPKLGPCDIDNPRLAPIVNYLHLKDPLPVQYVFYMQGLIQGNWGFSTTAVGGLPVTDAIVLYFPPTVELAVTATILAILFGIPTGTISAVKRDKAVDHLTRVFALASYSIPFFWLALLFQLMAVYVLPGWDIKGIYSSTLISPTTSSWAFACTLGDPSVCVQQNSGWALFSQPTHFLVLDAIFHGDGPVFFDALQHLVLPTLTLSLGIFGVILRMVRSGMVDSMNQDYVRTAWAKGLPENVVVRKHIRRNALLPATTVIGLLFAGLLGGVVLVEDVFSWPGIGEWATNAVLGHDVGGVLGTTLLFALFLMLTNLIVDVVYAYLDPRISL